MNKVEEIAVPCLSLDKLQLTYSKIKLIAYKKKIKKKKERTAFKMIQYHKVQK
jgi:hypothetical protein